MITMNDNISIGMTLTKAHLYLSSLKIAAYELRESDPETAKHLTALQTLIQQHLDRLDYSENEKQVDEHNAQIAEKANE